MKPRLRRFAITLSTSPGISPTSLALHLNSVSTVTYELGEILPSVLKRLKDLYGKTADAAQSWGNTADKEAVAKRKSDLSLSNAATSVEQWAVNEAVHYNEWANFGRKDFEPVVTAFKELFSCFSCDKCDSWLYVTPRANPETLRRRKLCNELREQLDVIAIDLRDLLDECSL